MRVESRNLPWTAMTLFLAGVFGDTWRVVYHQRHICAVSGSPAVIPCSFYYPDGQRVERFWWWHVKSGRFILGTAKFQYIGDKHHNCSVKIHQVDHNDAGRYVFRFATNSKEGKWTGRGGPKLKVADLSVTPNGHRTTKEGDSLNLTCVNACDGGGDLSSAFAWFKNGEAVNEGPVLYLSEMSLASSGNYTCSLKTHTGTTSGAVNINVEYGPKNTSVSLTEVDGGGSTALVCSSHANPPVENYTWFKVGDDDHDMDAGHQPEFFPGDGGQYLCRATNKHGSQNSSVVTLRMKPYWATFTRDALIIAAAAVAVLLIVITVIAVRRLHKKWTPETDSEGDAQDTDYVNWLACDNNQSQEGNQWEGETAEVVYTTVYFNNIRKSNTEQQMDSHTDPSGVSYITACRNQPWNASYIEPP